MAYGIKKLRRIQLGRETTAGTKVAATLIWRGEGTLVDDMDLRFVPEDVGFFSGVSRTMIASTKGTLEMDETPATFEQLPHIFEAGIKTVGTGVADGGGALLIYAYPWPTTATNAVTSYTVEGGDNQGEEEFAYGFVPEFKLSGSQGEPVTVSATWTGRAVAPGTFTTAPALTDVEEIIFSKGKLYIDDDTNAIGTTVIPASWLGFDLDCKTGWQEKFSGDGNLSFGFIKCADPEITLDITLENDSTVTAELICWRAETARRIRMIFEGSAGTAGTSWSYKTLCIDLAGRWEKWSGLEDDNGDDTRTGTFKAGYISTATALYANFRVMNKLASL